MFVRIIWLFLALAAFQLPAANAQEPHEEVAAEIELMEEHVGETHVGEMQDGDVHVDESHMNGEHGDGHVEHGSESHDEHGAVHADEGHGGGSHAGDSHGASGAHGEDGSHGGHADHHGGNTNPLSVDPDLMIFTGIIFCLLLAVLGKFAWGPIRDSLDQREKGIEAQIAEAHRSNEEARRLLAEHEAKVAKASDEVREMLDNAKAEAESQKANILAEAEAAAKSEKDRAVREIHAAKNTALEQLAESSVDQALGLAGSIVGKKLDKKDHTSLIQNALKQIPSDN